jgi:hypothetical protein
MLSLLKRCFSIHDDEGPVVSKVTRRYGSRGARTSGLDAGNGVDTKVLTCLLLSWATDMRQPSRVNRALVPSALVTIQSRIQGPFVEEQI